ncbi:MAG: hypothetical protein A3C93_03250 [Candidatus Lloydbacteria bacterium RIFCSPHIGHO2_02_FULL_54_17]|uniref:Quinolinate phosphoribosyltransferase [decarboxylating] n=1 Tax=Candidatus Lloydbacteria bacterium RIFCSPHIGHO2_02_FULL_54_17 TaxID=1798664 RepID=A0A1G2DGK6_9BACT|nr:MAG: hypothetical protein A2762_04270 [Candidatus Lloydbacteria bacterium RIFCSPHIGHO2_01_FULL_54_11]OGZ12091.1 MAG: hypothetical protein A3C93_03250 [Candidatus Lloydbacteria bacterium RIFCSPHIGHO2_02_FULL_54_17]OGZ15738.1 MAG: hypothetical protein A3H76_06380 [Candidatus Lloydbacteria bacterium RIFCSPLOWO2_02_FULL_54_12]
MTPRDILKQLLHHDLGFDQYRSDNAPQKTFSIKAKSSGVLSGTIYIPTILDLVEREFFLRPVGPAHLPVVWGAPTFRGLKQDGETVSSGDVVMNLRGNAEVLLKAERTILNMLSRLSGITMFVSREVKRMTHAQAKLLDTRKDPSLLRVFDKYAFELGGGHPHRAGFYDGIIVKDNDIAVYGLKRAIDRACARRRFLTKIEVEVGSEETLQAVLADGRVDVIMLDNMAPALLTRAVRQIRFEVKPYLIEASGIGGYDLATIAETGVDYISSSAFITQGAGNPLDLSMKVIV